jgi:hypothetical protein
MHAVCSRSSAEGKVINYDWQKINWHVDQLERIRRYTWGRRRVFLVHTVF